MSASVFGYFLSMFDVKPKDRSLNNLPLTTPCGQACAEAIDLGKQMWDKFDPHPDVRKAILEAVNAQIEILWRG